MSQNSWLEDKVDSWKDNIDYLTEEKILEFTECIVREMNKKNIKRVQLAEAIGKTKPFVTKLLKGDANMTVKTMVGISQALGCNLHIDLCPQGFKIKSFAVSDNFKPVDVDYGLLQMENICSVEKNDDCQSEIENACAA